MIVLSVGVNTASTPSATSASAAADTSALVVPVFSMYSIPFSSQKEIASATGTLEESWLLSYNSPIFLTSGLAAMISFMTAVVSSASDVPVIFAPGASKSATSPALTGSDTAENTTGI